MTILIFIFGYVCHGQTVSVLAYLEEGDAAVGASAQLLWQKNGGMFDFAVLEQAGDCIFRDVPSGDYLLRLKYFGYRDTTIRFSIGKGQELNFRFSLEPVAYNLPGVSVVDKIIGLKRRGDTLQYNLRAYLSGTEQTLGDILSNLPGIEIDSKGNVKVGNDKVDALLVNGNDIINDQHRLATEGIQSTLIESVELIQNYRNQGELFEGAPTTEKWAVNVILKDESHARWTGNAKLLGEIGERISTALNLFKAEESRGWSLFLRQNSIGDKPIEQPSALVLEDLTNRNEYVIDRVRRKFLSDHAVSPSLSEGATNNNDYHFAISGDIKTSKGIQNKLYATGTRGRRTGSISYQRNYMGLDLQERLATNWQETLPFLYLRNKLTLRKGNHFTEVLLPAQYHAVRQNETQEGTFGQDDFCQSQNNRGVHISSTPRMSHSVKFNQDFIFKFSQELNYERLDDDVSIASRSPFLQFEENEQGPYGFEQANRFESIGATSAMSLVKRWGRNFLKYEVSGASERASVDNISSQFFEAVEGRLYTRVLQHGVKGVKEWNRKVRLIGVLSQMSIRQRSDAEQHHQHYILPDALLYVEYYKNHAFSVSMRQEAEIPGFFYYNNHTYVQDSRTLTTHNLDPQAIGRTQNHTFSLFKNPLAGGNLYNLSFGYADLYKSFVTTTGSEDGFVKNGWAVVPRARRRFVNTFLMIHIGKWKINVNASLNAENGFASRQGILTALDRDMLLFNVTASSVRWNNWHLNVAIQNNSSWQRVEGSKTSFATTFLEGRLNYAHKNWNFRFDINQLFQRSNFQNNQFAVIGATIAYALKPNWKFYIEGNNLLNLASTTQIGVVLNPNFEQISTFGTFPGQIMLGAGYLF